MAEFPAIPLYTDAYLGDTRHLTTLQHGAYLLLIFTAWRTADCALPDNDDYLARCSGLDKRRWLQIRDVILSKDLRWSLGEDKKWRQSRLSDERKFVEQQRENNSRAGKVSALKRKGRHSTSVITSIQHNINQPTPTPTPTPTEPLKDPLAEMVYFPAFWDAFPIKTGQGTAREAYRRALTITTHEVIIEALKRQAVYLREKKYPTADPAKWLNGEHWKDDLKTLTAPKKKTDNYAGMV